MADYRSIYSGAQIDAGVGFGVAMTETAADTSAAVERVKQTPGNGMLKEAPEKVSQSVSDLSFTVADNTEYHYTSVTTLTMTGADVECHGIIKFGAIIPAVTISGFVGSSGDDITSAAASETWEFSCYANRIIWKNWGVEA